MKKFIGKVYNLKQAREYFLEYPENKVMCIRNKIEKEVNCLSEAIIYYRSITEMGNSSEELGNFKEILQNQEYIDQYSLKIKLAKDSISKVKEEYKKQIQKMIEDYEEIIKKKHKTINKILKKFPSLESRWIMHKLTK